MSVTAKQGDFHIAGACSTVADAREHLFDARVQQIDAAVDIFCPVSREIQSGRVTKARKVEQNLLTRASNNCA